VCFNIGVLSAGIRIYIYIHIIRKAIVVRVFCDWLFGSHQISRAISNKSPAHTGRSTHYYRY
jgi:hypothetical protein